MKSKSETEAKESKDKQSSPTQAKVAFPLTKSSLAKDKKLATIEEDAREPDVSLEATKTPEKKPSPMNNDEEDKFKPKPSPVGSIPKLDVSIENLQQKR